MNDLQIDYFLAVANNLSFTKTSELLYVSQPAISKQISLLEKELGVKLFYRNNKRTVLTEVGEMYYDFFRKFKTDLQNLQREAAKLQNKNTRNIRIGFIEGWDLRDILPQLMDELYDAYPDAVISIDCCGVKELTTLLMTGAIDAAVTFKSSLTDNDNFTVHDLCAIEKILIYSDKNHLAELDEVSVADFRNEKFFAPWGVAEKMITEIIYSYLRPYGFTPSIEFVHNNESMITCVRNNLGVAITDEWSFIKEVDDVKYMNLNTKDIVSVAHINNTNSEHTYAIVDILKRRIHN